MKKKSQSIQTILFDVPALRKDSVQKPYDPSGLPWAEDVYPKLSYLLVPLCILKGSPLKHDDMVVCSEKEQHRVLCDVFHVQHSKKNLSDIKEYLATEAAMMKTDSAKSLGNPGNQSCLDSVLVCVIRGALLLEQEGHMLSKLHADFQSLTIGSTDKLYFSRIARYFINGYKERFWYTETSQHLQELLPNFPQDILHNILAATSIRSSLKTNVKKTFRALHQWYAQTETTVMIGKQGEKKGQLSYFSGFLDAQIAQLNGLREGIPLGGGKKNRARKIRNFFEAMAGNPLAVVVDIWLMRAFNTDYQYPYKGRLASRSPSPKTYDAIEFYCQSIAALCNCEAREISAMIWVGIRGEFDTSTTRFETVIQKTLSHGLFDEIYGKLIPTDKGIQFKEH